MHQQSIALYLSIKGFSAKQIHRELVETLGREAVAYQTVTWDLRTAKFAGHSEEPPIETESTSTSRVDEAILKALAESPFSSVRELSRLTCLPRSTVYRHRTDSLCFTVRSLRWVLHRLSDAQKAIRANLSRGLLRMLEVQQSRNWHDIVTLDESWFYISTDHERIWLTPGEPVPGRERHMIQSPKLTITVVWNTSGFHVVAALPKGLKFNAECDTRGILQEILNWREEQGVGSTRKLSVHADNARFQTAKVSMDFLEANSMNKAPHPAYSPDLVPSDFSIFGDVKRQLNGCSFESGDDLFTAIRHILHGSDRPTLISVFHEWMRRLRKCIDTGGDSVG